MRISAKFNEFTYWNLQTPPSSQDKVTRALQWANLSSVVSSNIHASVHIESEIFCSWIHVSVKSVLTCEMLPAVCLFYIPLHQTIKHISKSLSLVVALQ